MLNFVVCMKADDLMRVSKTFLFLVGNVMYDMRLVWDRCAW